MMNAQVERLKALMIRDEEMKRTDKSESVIEACEIVLRLTDKTFSTFAEKSEIL